MILLSSSSLFLFFDENEDAKTFFEFFGGIFLVLGVLTRFASGGLVFTMLIAALLHFSNGDPVNRILHPFSNAPELHNSNDEEWLKHIILTHGDAPEDIQISYRDIIKMNQ